MTENRFPREDSFPRRRLKALCIIVMVLAFVGILLSGLVCFSDDIMREYYRGDAGDDGDVQGVRLRHVLERHGSGALARRLLAEALSRTDPEPFIAARPWADLRASMGLRLVSYGLIVLGAIMVFMGRRLGLRLMMAACLALMIHGAVEAAGLLQHGQFLVSEFYRDLRVNYLDLVDRMGLSDSFTGPLGRFPGRPVGMLRALDVLYFLIMTLLWQFAFVCLAWCDVMDRASAPASESQGSSS